MSHAIVSLDGKNGILKSSDATPAWTISSILAYIGVFGYPAFLDEYKRIESLGGACEGFYYVSEIARDRHFIQMLSSKELGFNCQEKDFIGDMKDIEFWYHVTKKNIRTYYYGKFVDISVYNENELRRDIIAGIFTDDMRNILKLKYRAFDFAGQ